MTESEAIKKAIRHFECMKNDAVVVLDSGFGTHQGESDLLYRNRKMYAELAINALEKQIPKKPYCIEDRMWCCPVCDNHLLHKWVKYPTELMPKTEGLPYCMSCGQKIDWNE